LRWGERGGSRTGWIPALWRITANASVNRGGLKGFDSEHEIRDVRFRNVVINGKPLQLQNVNQNDFVDGVSAKP